MGSLYTINNQIIHARVSGAINNRLDGKNKNLHLLIFYSIKWNSHSDDNSFVFKWVNNNTMFLFVQVHFSIVISIILSHKI